MCVQREGCGGVVCVGAACVHEWGRGGWVKGQKERKIEERKKETADTIANPKAVMVECGDTSATIMAVLRAQQLFCAAVFT